MAWPYSWAVEKPGSARASVVQGFGVITGEGIPLHPSQYKKT